MLVSLPFLKCVLINCGGDEKIPEGPEVRRIADVVQKAAGSQIIDVSWTKDPTYKLGREGIKNHERLIATITNVTTKGKLICIHLSNDYNILNTLGMTGTWVWGILPVKYARINLTFSDQGTLRFCDQRNFGTFKIVDNKAVTAKMKTIGWDMLQNPMSPNQWEELKTKKHIKDKPIGQVLMNQKICSGIGNIYKAEVLYEMKINPNRIVESIDQWGELNYCIHRILKNSYILGGSSVRSYSADGQTGSYQDKHKIYGKKQCPLGHVVSSTQQNDRTTWYCGTCQN